MYCAHKFLNIQTLHIYYRYYLRQDISHVGEGEGGGQPIQTNNDSGLDNTSKVLYNVQMYNRIQRQKNVVNTPGTYMHQLPFLCKSFMKIKV